MRVQDVATECQKCAEATRVRHGACEAAAGHMQVGARFARVKGDGLWEIEYESVEDMVGLNMV